MMTTISLQPGITLRHFRDTRFKQGCLSFQFLTPMAAATAASNALLPSVLLRGTVSCPDLRAITARLDTLYGAAVSPLVRRVGDYQTTGLYCSFMDDRFALPGDQVMAPMVDFLGQLLLDSPEEDGGFLSSFVGSEKKNLISTIESELNDKRLWSMAQLLKIMGKNDTFGLPRLGRVEEVAAITPQSLYRHREMLLRDAPIEIFYVGSAEENQVTMLLQPLVSRLPRGARNPLPPQTPLADCPGEHLRKTLDVSQGKLCLGYTTEITNQDARYPAMQVLNALFGAGMTSKLFQNVREKLSLCYSIGSSYYGSKGIATVSAGIDFDKETLTREEVARQLDACREGEISPQELTAAKEALLSALRATLDSPAAMEGYFATAALSGMPLDYDDYMGAIAAVTVSDVVECANTLKLHSSFFLEGGR